ncbi:MAG TPA: FtsX-like permease family protein [Verrucomicrobiae bacterium]|jgi:putative ABC transport system permease protein|nr:FtsX-like permease family protein [Verrucomicrobiae bacterium]
MKFSGLVFANLFRKKLRLLLTLGSFGVALFLFGFLAVVRAGFGGGVQDVAGADRVVTLSRSGFIQLLPRAYQDRMLRIPGVKAVTFDQWFGGVYQDEKNGVTEFAIDVANQRQVFPEMKVPEDQWEAFIKDRRGAIVGVKTAQRFGWKVGDHIPIKGTIFAGTWDFNLDGIYHGRPNKDDETQFWFQWDYLQERVGADIKGQVGWYTVRIANPDDAARISKAIDAEFANSPYETHSDPESVFFANWVKQFGNIQLLILSIGGVVFFTLLLVTGNTMAIAVRERTAELAVLKAVGYSDRFVMLFVLSESLVIALIGGGLGLVFAKVITTLWNPLPGVLQIFYFSPQAMLTGLLVTLAVGAISGLLPAIGAMRLRVVDALRRV